MQRHLDCEKHQRALERHTLLDSEQRQVELFTFRLVNKISSKGQIGSTCMGPIASKITFAKKKIISRSKTALVLARI